MNEQLVEAYDLFHEATETLCNELKKAGVDDELIQEVRDLVQLQGLAGRSYYSRFKDMGTLTELMNKNRAFIDRHKPAK